ncbi:hypothetical protein [Marinicrinis lubricantis]|uniref:Uncharacterized protein n=1 Tax=Marinicrinis lubricantis TaxID=2086470 RepID=A0ABW1INN0_9BACL
MKKKKDMMNETTFTFAGVTTPPEQNIAATDNIEGIVEQMMDSAEKAIFDDSKKNKQPPQND